MMSKKEKRKWMSWINFILDGYQEQLREAHEKILFYANRQNILKEKIFKTEKIKKELK